MPCSQESGVPSASQPAAPAAMSAESDWPLPLQSVVMSGHSSIWPLNGASPSLANSTTSVAHSSTSH